MPKIAPPKMHMNTIKLIQTELIKKSPERKQIFHVHRFGGVLRAACLIHVPAYAPSVNNRISMITIRMTLFWRQLHTGVDRTITVLIANGTCLN